MKPEVRNIAEGFESQTQAQFIQLLSRAKGSSGELRAQLYLAFDRKYISEDEFNRAILQSETCSKQLSRFIQYLDSKPNTRRVRDGGAIYDVD